MTVAVRLDTWQHEHEPDGDRHPRLFTVWYYVWRPVCNYVDRRIMRRNR